MSAFLDGATGHITIEDGSDAQDNDVTLSYTSRDAVGPDVGVRPGLLITSPGGVSAGTFGMEQVDSNNVFVPDFFDNNGGSPGGTTALLTSTVDVDLQSGDDRLIFASNFDSVPVVTALNVHGGDNSSNSDVLRLNGTTGAAENISIGPTGIGGDELGIGGYAGVSITSRGYEIVDVVGEGNDDSLTVNPGDDSMTTLGFDPTASRNRLVSDRIATVDFDSLDTFTLSRPFGGPGSDTVYVDELHGGNADQFIYDSNSGKELIAKASEGDSSSFTIGLNGSGDIVVSATPTHVGTPRSLVITSNPDLINVQGEGGDDALTVDTNNGLIGVPIQYDGGDGNNDILFIQGSTGVNSVEYTPGPTDDAGALLYDAGEGMRISFTGLEPVVDTIAAATLIVNGTNADNAINYSVGLGGATNGLVSVDAYETIEFSNKGNLTINALAGSDTINLNNPNTPTSLTGITVNAGDPTGSDTVIVNGTTGADAIGVGSLTLDSAVVTGAQPVPVTVTTAESLVLDGRGGGDNLTYTSPLNGDFITYHPGASYQSGMITAVSDFAPLNEFLPVSFENVGFGLLTIADAAAIRDDTLIVQGLGSDDHFTVNSSGRVELRDVHTNLPYALRIDTPGIDRLQLQGLDGDDVFDVPGNHPFSGTLPSGTEYVIVEGGNPDTGSDVLNFNGSGAGAVTVDLQAQTVTETGQLPVGFTGIETLNANASGQALTAQGTTNDDTVAVTPYGGGAGTLQANGQAPVVNYTNVAANTVDVNTLGGDDRLIVNATSVADNITVNVPGSSVDTGASGGLVSFSNAEALHVNGLEGDDTFAVTPGTIPVSLNGGDPIAASDTVTIDAAGIGPVTFNAGPLADEGSFSFAAAATVSYDNLEGAAVINTGMLTVNGTNGDDTITVVGTGVNSVDVSVNNGPVVSYSGVTDLTVDGLNGDDDIDIAINNLALQTFNVIGGLPSAGSDTVTVTGPVGPFNDNASWAPTAIDGGTFAAGTQVINISGVERVVYDGQAGDEILTVIGFAPANRFIHTPGGAGDEGSISVTDIGLDQSGLGIDYMDLGLQGRIDIQPGGAGDILVAFGTASNDSMDVMPITGDVVLHSNFGNSAASAHVAIRPLAPIQDLILDALDGDDTFNITGPVPVYTDISLEGGDPSASDVANLIGDGSGVIYFMVPGTQTVLGGGFGTNSMRIVGIEEVNLNAGQAGITLGGSIGPETFDITPTATNTAQILAEGVNQVLNTDNAGQLLISEGVAGDGDTVNVLGTSMNDTITVTRGATTTVNVGGLKQVDLISNNIEALNINAGQGDDTINVTGTGGSPLTIDGGEPTASDTLAVLLVTAGGPATVVMPGSTPDAGEIQDAQDGDIDFMGIEHISLTGAAPTDDLIVEGTNASDTIALGFQGANRVLVNDRADVTFNTFDSIVLAGRAGDDKVSVYPVGLVGLDPVNGILVAGGDPTASDELVVNGTTGNDAILFTPISPDAGSVGITGAPVVTFNTTESVVINAGADTDNDTLTVATTGNNDRVVYTPGDTIDSASVRVNSFVPMSFLNIGAAGAVTISDPGGAADELVYEGTAASDLFTVAGVPVIGLNSQVAVGTVGIDQYRLQGLGGDDTFNLTAVPGVQTTVEGDGPGASDVLNFTSTGPTAVDLGNSLINDAATPIVPDVAYSGIETLNVNASNQTLMVFGSATDDTIRVTPYGAFAGTLQANGQAPVVNYSNVNANTINVDPLGGQNVMVVNATPGNDAVIVNVPAGSVDTGATGGIVNFNVGNTDALHVNGREGDDTFAVTPDVIPVSINGGDPIGGSDDINLIVPFGAGTVTFHPGPLADEGSFTFSGAGFEPVSFDNIEGGWVDLSATTGALVINGTNGDDDITVVGDDSTGATDDLFVSINDGPSIRYLGVTNLTVDGMNGDDDIDVDINDLSIATVNVIGSLPSGGSDTVTVTGVAGPLNDNASWQPTGADSGTFIAGAQAVAISDVERVIYDGESGDESLTVIGGAPANRFIHTPGGAGDEGSVSVTDIGLDISGLGIEYVDLGLQGLINISPGGPNDILVAFGTGSNDVMNLAPGGVVGLQSNFGNSAASAHVPIVPLAPIQDLILDTLGGDDVFNITAPQPLYTNIRLEGGDPSASDVANLFGDGSLVDYNTGATVQTVVGGGFGVGPMTIVGIEEVNLDNGPGPINVNGTAGPNAFHVTPTATNTAQILVDGVNQVLNTDNTGLLTITEGTAGDGDTVTVYGTSANDVINVLRGPTTQVTVVGLKQIDVHGGNVEALNVNAGQGDDLINVSGVGGSPLTINGGDPTGLPGHDTVLINFANVGTASVDPGATPDAGFIHGPTAAEDVAFDGLEALQLVGVGASTLVVNGTMGDDSITQLNGNAVAVNDRAIVGFQDFPTLVLAGLPGDDTISVDPTTLVGVTTVNVSGSAPSASDELIVNGTSGNDAITFTPTDPDAGSVAIAGAPIVNFTTTESVVINAGASNDNDTLTVVTTAGDDQVVYTPGDTIDSAGVRVNSFVPMQFVNLGVGGTVTIDDSAGGTDDELIYVGTLATDTFEVAGVPVIGLNDQLDLNTTDIEFYTLQGLGGDDTFDITAVDDVQITVQGDEPGNGSDVLNFTSTGATTIDLGNSEIEDLGVAGSPDVVYSGIETINVDANSQDLTVLGTAGDDTIRVTPFGGDAGTLQANGVAPVVNYSNVNLNTINVDPLGGEDRVIVNATADADAVTVDVPGGTVDTGASGGIVAFTLANTEALHVNGLEGDDSFDVTPGSIPVSIDGGDPIGASDILNLLPTETPTFAPGPEADEGSFSFATDATVSFDHIEAATVDLVNVPAQDAIILGTGADDDITAIGHPTNNNEVDVQVNAGPIVTYTNALMLDLEAGNGDDDIDVDINNSTLGVTFNVDGGMPSTNGDIVTVTGVPGLTNDNALWEPTANTADEGQMTVGGQTINIEGAERVIYDGENEDELLTVLGTGAGDRFVHTPGAARDAGAVSVDNGATTLLGIEYVNLGLLGQLQIDANGDNDTLVARGTDGSDVMDVDFPAAGEINVTLHSGLGQHVVLQAINGSVENFEIRSLEGDDDVNVTGPVYNPLAVFAGGPGAGSDTLNLTADAAANAVAISQVSGASDDQWIAGLGAGLITSNGVELITLTGTGNDTLNVFLGAGDDTARVARGDGADVVTSSSLPAIEFTGLDGMTVTGEAGSDVVTFATWNLSGAVNTNYAAVLGGVDTLVIEGADGAADAYTLTAPGAGQVQVDDANGTNVRVTAAGMGRVQVNTLGGDDAVTVTNTGGLIDALIGYDGGTGSDVLTVDGAWDVTNATYSPGPAVTEGRLMHDTQTIDFVNLEPVLDWTVANTLTVNGTNADNAITYTEGQNSDLVSVDAYETIEFTNKTNLVLNGLAGDDVISLNDLSGATTLTSIAVDGGAPTASDTLIVTGAAGDGADTVTWTPSSADSGTMTLAGPMINVTTTEHLIYDGQSVDDDSLIVSGFGQFVHTPGAAIDAGSMGLTTAGMTMLGISYENLGGDGDVTASGTGGDDTLVALGTAGSDVMVADFVAVDAIDIDLTSAVGTHVDLLSSTVENYEIRSGEGDDDVTIIAPLLLSGSLGVMGGGPGGSDTVNFDLSQGAFAASISPDIYDSASVDVVVGAILTDVQAFELIRFIGNDPGPGGDDDLTYDLGVGDHDIRVEDGPALTPVFTLYDRVTSSVLPIVEYGNMNSFTVLGQAVFGFDNGANEVTFATGGLIGATTYVTHLNELDTLIIEGESGSADHILLLEPDSPFGPGSVAVIDVNAPVVPITITDVTIAASPLGSVVINTFGGDDLLEVDTNNGLIRVPITLDGGANSDSILVHGDPSGAEGDDLDQVEYMPGPDVLEGRLLYDLDWTSADTHEMMIDFINMEPVVDLTYATVAVTVYGTNADNAINFMEGPNTGGLAGATGLVSVDGFETFEFANKLDVLEIIGLAGDDVVNINYQGAVAPDGLERVWVEGNDPTASDKLVVNAMAGTTDALIVTPGDLGAGQDGRVSGTAIGYLPVDYMGIEELALVGQLADFDTFEVDGTLGYDLFEYFSGDTPDTGMVRGLMDDASFALPEINFSGMHPMVERSFGTTTFDPANEDDFVFYATDLDDEIFYDGANHELSDSIDGTLVTWIQLGERITGVLISAENGSDTIDVIPRDGVSVIVQGGNPGGGSDVLNYYAAGETTVELATNDIEDDGSAGTRDASFSGIEVLNIDAAANQFNVTGITGVDEDITVTVYDANSGKVELGYAAQRAGQVATEIGDPVIYYMNTDGNAANFNLGDGDDQDTLIVIASTFGTTPPAVDAPQVINVDVPGRRIDIDDENDTVLDGVVTWEDGGIESVEAWGLEGDDTFYVTPGNIPVFIDGGDPIGTTPGDEINIVAGGDPVVFEVGPESDEGGFVVGAHQRVSFDHIESLGVFQAAKAIILGTSDDDEITIIARDDSTHVGTDGVQDFTTTVNASPEVTWIDTPLIFVDANSGDDDITLRTPAPNVAQWDVEVFVAGGPASTPEVGDRLRVETPYEDHNTIYQPTAPDAGIMEIWNTSGVLHSTIYIGGWDLIHGDPPLEYHSSPGGVETLLYDGISAEGTFDHDNNTGTTTQNPADAFTDTLTVLGDGFVVDEASDDHFVHTPGNAPDAGSIAMFDLTNEQTMLGISYNNIGLAGTVTINGLMGENSLAAMATQDSDVMEISFPGSDSAEILLTTADGEHVPLLTANVADYELRTLEGDDEIYVQAPVNISGELSLFGGGPSGSDALFLLGAAATVEDVLIEPDSTNPLDQDVTGLGALINVSGKELISYIAVDDGGGTPDDMLTVDPGSGDQNVRIDDGPLDYTDRVISDTLPEIQFTQVDTFLVAPSTAGVNVVTFVTRALMGAVNYHADLAPFDALVIEGTEGADDTYIVTHPAGANVAITDNNSGVTVTELDIAAAVAGLRINTLGGDDTVYVDVGSDDLINVPMEYNGGGGSDILIVSGDPATTVDEVIYAPGPALEEGRLTYEDDTDTIQMLIDFTGLEPVVDAVPAATLTVLGTTADNAIDYGPGVIDPVAHGLVTVDAYESIEFTNKGTLVIDALAGDDVVSINNQETPTDLTLIEVDGGDPTASDKLVYTGSDAITVTQGAMPYDGTITNPPLPPVDFTDIENVAVTATGATDTLTIEGTDDNERIAIEVGDAWGEGAAQVDSGFTTTFTGAEQVDVVANDALFDNLTINGRDAADRFSLSTGGLGTTVWARTNESVPQPLLYITFGDDVEDLLLETLGGDDIVDIDAEGIAVSGLLTVTASGDGPSGSDHLNFMRYVSGEDQVIVELDADLTGDLVQEISQAGIVAPVRLLGMETAFIDVEGGDLYVAGTRADDVITYTSLSSDSGMFSAASVPTVFAFEDVPEGSSEFVITGGGTGTGGPPSGGTADKVIVNGTSGSDLLTANVVTRNIGLDVLGFGFPPPVVATWRSVTLDDGTTAFGTPGIIEAVTVDGMDGNDTFHVVMRDDGTPAEPVGDGLYVDIQGGSPRASDALVITAFDDAGDPVALPATDFVVIGKSRIPDSGNILVYQSAVRRPHISYDNIEVVSPNVASGDNLLTLGPDMYEENEYRQTAAILGTADVINLMNLSIFPNMYEHAGVPADQDWYAVKAEKTGTLDIGISFRTFPTDLLPSGGQLGIEVVDEDGFVIAGDGTFVIDIVPSGFGAYDGDPDARVRFPAIAGQTYRFRVFGQTDSGPFVDDGLVVNDYDMTIINEAAPVPYDIELADIVGVSTVAPGAVLNVFSGTPSDTLSEVDDFYNGKYVYFVSGNLAGRRAEIADYVAVGNTFTLVAGGVSLAPSAGSEFLVETHDTGRSQLDDVTRDETPVIRFRLDDAGLLYDLPGNTYPDTPLDESIRIPFNPDQTQDTSTPGYRVAIFIEGELQQPGAEPQVPIGYARPIDFDMDGIPDGIYEFDFGADAIDLGDPNGPTTAYPLTDGSHFLTAKVQIIDPDDPDNDMESLDNLTAFGVRSVSHEIVVDTMIPPVWFGDPLVAGDGLHPDSDTGIEDQPAKFTDEITSDTTPSFWGIAEADTIVYVYADLNDNDVLDLDTDLLLGKTVAIPLDGTNQFPNGQWNMTTNIDMNDPLYFPTIDGTRTIFVIAEDVAGNIDNPEDAEVLDIFIDTRGPQVNDVQITTAPAYDLFDPKPSTDGPTPLVFSLDIDFIDRPPRDAPFIYPAVNEILATADGNIVLVGDYNGVIPIESIDFIDYTVDGGLGTTTVRLNFFDPLPDDRFTLTVSDRIMDCAGNALDGESHAQEPQEVPQFPSGDGVPGEDFIARFTVDSRPEVATYAAGSVYADTNGNTFFDPDNLDYTNRDIIYNYGFTSDDLFVGNFSDPMDDPPIADGFDKLAAYGRVPGGGFRWLVDLDNDGVPDLDVVDPLQVNGVPVAGNFNGNSVDGDEVGLYTAYPKGGSVWYFDTNHDFMLDAGSELVSDLHGVPFVGDFNGDGLDDLGTWQDDTFSFDLAPWDGSIDVSFRYGFIGVRERPVAADLDQDGYDDVGLWVPDRSGVTPEEGAEWYFLVSDGASLFDRIVFNTDLGVSEVQYTPVPFGPDLFMQFGEDYAMPLLGNFDPPVAATGGDSTVFQVAGTDGDDVFTFIAGSDTIVLNGVEQTIPAGTESVVFNGGGGQDTAFLRGSDGDDVFTAGPDGATLEGPGYSVTTQSVEINHGYGYDGNDVATLTGSDGDDNFKADLMDDYAKMSGGGFYARAKFFENVTGAMGTGDDDYARLWDSDGSDQMTAAPNDLTLTTSQFTVNVEGYNRLLAYSTYGGVDTANLYDSEGDDTMRARSHKTLFWGPGFDMTLRGWEDVLAHSENGGVDQAKLHDTLANDVVLTGDDWASLSTVVDEELDLLYAAYGFDAVKAYHSEGNDKSPDPDAIDFFMLDDEDLWDIQ